MAEYKQAVVLAALMFIYRPNVGDKAGGCECTTVSALIVLTAAFVFVASADLANPFSCKLPPPLLFLYEFLVSLFIFEVAARVFWDRAECFLVDRLPAAASTALGGGCVLFGLVCPSPGSLLFVALAYLVALALLCTVLYGYGVLTAPIAALSAPRLPIAIPLACRRCLRALKGEC